MSTWTGVGVCAVPTLPAKSCASTRTYIVAGLPDRSGQWYWPELSRLEPMGRQGPFAFSAYEIVIGWLARFLSLAFHWMFSIGSWSRNTGLTSVRATVGLVRSTST